MASSREAGPCPLGSPLPPKHVAYRDSVDVSSESMMTWAGGLVCMHAKGIPDGECSGTGEGMGRGETEFKSRSKKQKPCPEHGKDERAQFFGRVEGLSREVMR